MILEEKTQRLGQEAWCLALDMIHFCIWKLALASRELQIAVEDREVRECLMLPSMSRYP